MFGTLEMYTGSVAVLSFATLQFRDMYEIHTRPHHGALTIPVSTMRLHTACCVNWLIFGWLSSNVYVMMSNIVYLITLGFLYGSPRVRFAAGG